MDKNEKWLQWAVELQSIAQAGLCYGKDEFDKERYERIRAVAAEMISYKSGIPIEKVRDLFCGETGYQTPKIDTRAAIFKAGRILLVREKRREMVASRRMGGRGYIRRGKCNKRGKRRSWIGCVA